MRFAMLLAAVAALWVQPASAAVTLIHEDTGFEVDGWGETEFSPQLFSGEYRAEITTDVLAYLSILGYFEIHDHWPPPGNSSEFFDGPSSNGPAKSLVWKFSIPRNDPNPPIHDNWAIVLGAFEIESNYSQSIGGPVNYSFRIFSVPEPATWAMLILGFGAIGAAMRRRGHLVASAAPAI